VCFVKLQLIKAVSEILKLLEVIEVLIAIFAAQTDLNIRKRCRGTLGIESKMSTSRLLEKADAFLH